MRYHVKPTVRDFDWDHIILYYRINNLSSERTATIIKKKIPGKKF